MSESEITVRIPECVSIPPAERTGDAAFRDRDHTSQPLAPASLWQRVLSFPALLGSLLVGGVAIIARTFFVDPDVWWHIKQGGVILATHHVPAKDIYSLTLAGRPWTAYEWLCDILLA